MHKKSDVVVYFINTHTSVYTYILYNDKINDINNNNYNSSSNNNHQMKQQQKQQQEQ